MNDAINTCNTYSFGWTQKRQGRPSCGQHPAHCCLIKYFFFYHLYILQDMTCHYELSLTPIYTQNTTQHNKTNTNEKNFNFL